MKKALYLLAFVALPAFSFAQDSKTADKEKLVTKCLDDVKSQMGEVPADKADAIKSFCSCQADNILKDMTFDQYEALEKEIEAATPEKQQELAQKLMPYVMPCLEQLQKEMGQ